MRPGMWLAAALLAGACAPKVVPWRVAKAGPVTLPAAQPTIPSTPPPKPVPKADFELIVSETVDSLEDDLGSYAKVYVDRQPAGETQIAAKSQDKTWEAVLPPGNHLFRFEEWYLPSTGDWTMLDPQWQPPERFIRVDPGQKTVVRLRFYDGGLRNKLEIERRPLE